MDDFKQSTPNIVETKIIGSTIIHFADDYIQTDPIEIERIISEFHSIGWIIHQSKNSKEKAG